MDGRQLCSSFLHLSFYRTPDRPFHHRPDPARFFPPPLDGCQPLLEDLALLNGHAVDLFLQLSDLVTPLLEVRDDVFVEDAHQQPSQGKLGRVQRAPVRRGIDRAQRAHAGEEAQALGDGALGHFEGDEEVVEGLGLRPGEGEAVEGADGLGEGEGRRGGDAEGDEGLFKFGHGGRRAAWGTEGSHTEARRRGDTEGDLGFLRNRLAVLGLGLGSRWGAGFATAEGAEVFSHEKAQKNTKGFLGLLMALRLCGSA